MADLPRRPVLLDTHIWIWVMEGAVSEMGQAATEAVAEAGATGRVLVSPISAWEVAMLVTKGRIRLTMDVAEWVRRSLSAPGVRIADFTPEIAVDSARLPAPVHGDPADRMLIATARRTGATLVTRDARIVEYADQGLLSVIDATP